MNKFYRKYLSSLLGIVLALSMMMPTVHAESTENKMNGSNQVEAMLGKGLQFYKAERFDEKHFPWGPPTELSWTEVVALQASSSFLTDGTLEQPKWLETDPGFKATTGNTEHIRYIMGLLAADKDPSDAWETNRNLYNELADQQKENGSIGGTNKHIWAMLALDTGEKLGYTIDQWTAAKKKKALDYLLSVEIPGGGFALGKDKAEPDMTAMALLTLANYQDDKIVQETIERALTSLHQQQMDSAGWGTYNTSNSNSIATVISGLLAVQQDPLSVQWQKNGLTPLDALQEFQLDNGAFAFTLGSSSAVNMISTEQSLLALQEIHDGQSVWQQLADPTPTNQDPSIQLPDNVEKTIKEGKIHFRIKDENSGEWKPAKVERKLLIGDYMTVQISESAKATEGTNLPSGDKKMVVLENDRPYTYFQADKYTSPTKEWEVKFSAPLLNEEKNLDNVTVRNADGEVIAAEVSVQAEGKSVKITPDSNYKSGELYYITIADVLSAKGTLVKEPIRKVFIVEK